MTMGEKRRPGEKVESFIGKIENDNPVAFVLGGGSPNGLSITLSITRSLARKGIPVVAVDRLSRTGLTNTLLLIQGHGRKSFTCRRGG